MNGPRILLYDLETAGVNALNSDLSAIVNFGYKFVGEKRAHCLTIDKYEDWWSPEAGLNDRGLLVAALELFERADISVAHYGERFDKRAFTGRCVIHGLTPPAPAKLRDTWRIARDKFNFSSNRLQHLADILGCGEKKYHKKCPSEWPGWWLKAMAGNVKAIHEMARYCMQDVQTLEQVYLRLRPFDTAHPRIVENREHCGVCDGAVQYRGYAIAKENRYHRFQCTACGKWGQETKKIQEGEAVAA